MENHLKEILNYAARAPSGHNTQPWKIRLNDHTMEVFFDPARALPEVDPSHREALLSVASFAQTLLRSADATGIKTEIERVGNDPSSWDEPLFKFVLSGSPSGCNSDVLSLIEARYSDRGNYDRQEISGSTVQNILGQDPDRLAYFPKASKEGRLISEYHVDAFSRQSYNKEKQGELAEWLRFKRSDKKSRADGLFPEMMAMSPIARFFWYTLFTRKTATKDSFIQTSIKNAEKQIENTPGFLVITSRSTRLPDLLDAGRLYMDVLLKCTELEVKNHTISQILEEDPWKDTISDDLALKHPVQFIIRTGTSKSEGYGPHIRRSLNQIIQ